MGRKYTIELEEKPFFNEKGNALYRVKGFRSLVFDEQGIEMLKPYTEPDIDAIRNEAYEKGLTDAWDAARKIWEYNATTLNKIFNKCCYSVVRDILRKYSASEVIEKIRQWEDMKIFKPGNEVVSTCGVGIVTKVTRTGVELFHKDGSTGYDRVEAVKKTGRHFPEFVELLAKMKGESNDPD